MRTPPEMTCSFLNNWYSTKKLCGLLEETSAPPPKKILDPPLDVHILLPKYCRQKHIPTFLFYMYQPKLDILFARKVKAKIAYFRFYYIHCEMTGHPCNLIGSQQCDLSHHKSHFVIQITSFLNRVIHVLKSHRFWFKSHRFCLFISAFQHTGYVIHKIFVLTEFCRISKWLR